jgi:AcrR family transcriptional regulator
MLSLGMPRTADVQSPPHRRLSAPERRAQIIAGAREVFVEQGVNGARTREIAQRAGITEAYLYRHFHSKDEMFQLAVGEPLDDFLARLRDETRELAARTDVDRVDVLLRCHELMLECMVQIAPLVAAALLSRRSPNNQFYADYLFPRLRKVLVEIIPDITGYALKAFELDLFVDALIGIHLTIALEHLLENEPVDVPKVAKQVTEMFAVPLSPAPAPAAAKRRSRSTSATSAPAPAPAKRVRSPRSASAR